MAVTLSDGKNKAEPYLGSESILRDVNAIQFPACCAFTTIGKFERMPGGSQSEENFKKQVLLMCDKPAESYFHKPPAGTFTTLLVRQKKEHNWLTAIGFEVILEAVKNPCTSGFCTVYYRPHPAYVKAEAKKVKKTKKVF